MVLFFLTSRKNAAGPKGQAFEASHKEAQVSSGHPKGRVMRTWQSPYEIRNHWRQLRRGWSLVPAVGPFYSARTVSSPSSACQALDKKSWWEAKSLLACLHTEGGFDSWYRPSTNCFLVWEHIDGRYRPIFFWYESILTVDFDWFLGKIDGRSNIDRIFK